MYNWNTYVLYGPCTYITSFVFPSSNPTGWLLCYFFLPPIRSNRSGPCLIGTTNCVYLLFTWRRSTLLPTRCDYCIIIIIFSRFVNIAIATNLIDSVMNTTTNCVYFCSLGGWRPLCDWRRILWCRILNAHRHQWGHRLPRNCTATAAVNRGFA